MTVPTSTTPSFRDYIHSTNPCEACNHPACIHTSIPLGISVMLPRCALFLRIPLIVYAISVFAFHWFLHQSRELASNSNSYYADCYNHLSGRAIDQLKKLHLNYPAIFRITFIACAILACIHVLFSIPLALACGFFHAVLLVHT